MYLFDRYFKYFINKICGILIVVILILLAFFLGLWKADAAEISYSSANYQVGYVSLLNGSTTNTGYRDLGNGYVFDGNSYLNVLYLQTFGNNTIIFKEGNTYTFTYLINFNPKQDLRYYHFDKTELTWYGNTSASASGLSTEYISNGTINIENVTTGSQSNYQMKFTFSFTPTDDIKYTLFRLEFPVHSISSPAISCGSINGDCPYVLNSFNVVSLKINEETGTAGAIQNQTNIIINNQNQNTDKVIDSITSDNTDKSESTGKNFFDNFELEDNGSISSIVTTPLRLIQSLINNSNTCSNLDFNISLKGKNKDVSIPNGCDFWSKVPDSVIGLYHILVYGLITYRMTISLFKIVEDFKDPTNSEVKTLDL